MPPVPHGFALRATWLALFAGLGAYALHVTTGAFEAHDFFDTYVYNGLLVAGAALCLLRPILVPTDRLAWLLIGGGLAAWCAADIYWTFALADLEAPPYPSLSDAGWIVLYPTMYAAVILMVRRNAPSVDRSRWLDGIIGASATAAFVAAVVLPPILDMSLEGTTSAVVTNLAYPVGDILTLSLLIGIFGVLGWRLDRRWVLLGAGLILSAIADMTYLFQTAHDTYDEHTWTAALWPAASLVTALAAWQPTNEEPAREPGMRLLVVPGLFTLLAFGVMVWDHFERASHLALGFASLTLLTVFLRMSLTFRDHLALLGVTKHEAQTDSLTGLGNRRLLHLDLDVAARHATPNLPYLLLLFDLNGFKAYNDRFGHPAGDALLARLGRRLSEAAGPDGDAYRMGGDEFCVLAGPGRNGSELLEACLEALSEHGEGFGVTSAFGGCEITGPEMDASEALRRADGAMYAQKDSTRASAGGQSMEVLIRVLAERDGMLAEHLGDVASLCERVGARLGLSEAERVTVARAGVLHDVGKAAIPDAILTKPGPLDEEEWSFMRRHTIIGERILHGAPSLGEVAKLVRSSHERWNGSGYPDGLVGEQIALGARIIAVCDAFDAMVTDRPYRTAMTSEAAVAELERCAGTQFDPDVVRAFAEVWAKQPVPA